MNTLKKAISTAKIAHKGQKRLSGEDFCNHPLRVAKILSKLGAPMYVQVAAALHDTLEDTNLTEEEIQKICGESGLFIVKALTITENTKKGYFKRLKKSTKENGWCILVKLADKLDNLKDMDNFSRERKKRFVREIVKEVIPIFNYTSRKLSDIQIKIGDRIVIDILMFINDNFETIYSEILIEEN